MNGTYGLPDVLVPYVGESLPGLVLRYAALYPGLGPIDLFARLGLPKQNDLLSLLAKSPSSEQGREVLDLLNVPMDRRAQMTLWSGNPRRRNVLGHSIRDHLCTVRHRRFCPECLSDAPYHRAVWMVGALPACGVHGCMLAEHCPGCGQRPGWSGAGVLFCQHCNSDFRHATVPQASAAGRRAVRELSSLLSGTKHPAGWDFDDALVAALALGSFRTGGAERFAWAEALTGDRVALLSMLSAGWDTIAPWPDNLETYLDTLASGAGARKAGHGLKRAYGRLAQVLGDSTKTPWARPVLSVMADRLTGDTHIAIRRTIADKYASKASAVVGHMTLAEAAVASSISESTMTRRLARYGLRRTGPGNGKSYHLDKEQLRQMADQEKVRASFMTSSQAVRALCIDPGMLPALVAEGVVQHVPEDERLSVNLKFRVSDIENLLLRLEAVARDLPGLETCGPEHRTWSQGGFRDGRSMSSLVRLTLEGKLIPVGILRGSSGIRRYVYPKQIELGP